MEVSGVAGVIEGVLVGLQDEPAEATMHVANDASAPMVGGGLGDADAFERKVLPAAEFHDLAEAEIGDEVSDVFGDDDDGGASGVAAGMARECAERGPMEVIEVRVRDQNGVERRQVADTNAGAAQAL